MVLVPAQALATTLDLPASSSPGIDYDLILNRDKCQEKVRIIAVCLGLYSKFFPRRKVTFATLRAGLLQVHLGMDRLSACQ